MSSFIPATQSSERCLSCDEYRSTLHALVSRASSQKNETKVPSTSSTSHVNLRFLSDEEQKMRLADLQKKNRALTQRVSRLTAKVNELIETNGAVLDEEISSDLQKIIMEEDNVVTKSFTPGSFQHIFWEQQKKNISRSAKGVRWHPLIIRWCLYLRHQSSKAYEVIHDSGIVSLPSQRTLRDYTNCIKADGGYSHAVDQQLLMAINNDSCPTWHKLIILLLDEMYIKESLVYHKHTGQLIGFTDLGDINNHLLSFERMLESDATLPQHSILAKSMFVIMVKGLFTPFRFPYAHFPCSSLTGDLLFDPFWEGVYRLEIMDFKVLGSTFDGASVNRCLVKIHNRTDKLIYKVPNPNASDGRLLYFFSDPPHLIKTTRNCWASNNRSLWNNEKSISWQHLVDLYECDKGRGTGLSIVTKLTYEHLHLSSFSKMSVDLAAQVLSESVATAIENKGGPDVEETVKFIRMFDTFFDILNVRTFDYGTKTRKSQCHPYQHYDDERLEWLEMDFLSYLDSWEQSVMSREGYSLVEKKRMLLSEETLLGLRRTAMAFVELVRYLFTLKEVKENDLAFLSNNICQDPLENYFGCQRQRGATNDNPTVNEFQNNTQALRVVNSLCRGTVRGNCRGAGSSKVIDTTNCTAPLPKRRKK